MRILLTVLATALMATPILATDWLTLPAKFSHDPMTGMRVTQYAPKVLPEAPVETSFRSSGYRQHRSTLAYGQSADNYHRVETWGDPVRPYGEWRFPFRPYSTPYPNWGPPFGGLNINQGFIPGFGAGYGPGIGGGGFPVAPGQTVDPSVDPANPTAWDRGGRQGRRGRPGFNGGSAFPQGGINPYPAGPQSPYPVAPYYDGYYPTYRD